MRREVKSGMYSFCAYFVAQLLVQIPYLFLLSAFCISVSGYGIGGWNIDAFFPSLLVHASLMFAFECVAQCHAVQFQHPLLGMLGVVNFWFASFLFGGMLIPEEDVIWPLRAFGYISPIKYAVKALLNLEMKGTTFSGAEMVGGSFYCPGSSVRCFGATGEQVLYTLSQSIARNVKVEGELLEDCLFMLATAALFKVAFLVVALVKCYDGKEVKPSTATELGSLPNLLAPNTGAPKNRGAKSEEDAAVDV